MVTITALQLTIAVASMTILYGIRLLLLPRPIPGIPYTKRSANRVLGDLPDVVAHIYATQEVASFIPKKASEELKSPIFQFFIGPFRKPWVVITDFRESQDIITRRTREFDRSTFFYEIFSVIVPGSMVHMPTNDVWKAQRKLVGDTMAPAFLDKVSAPTIYENSKILLEFWEQKARLACGHPVDIKEDLYRSALDTIWGVTFGSQMGATPGQIDRLKGVETLPLADDMESEVIMPKADEPQSYKSIHALTESLGIPASSALPVIHHWLELNFRPTLRRATQHKEELITDEIHKAVEKFSSPTASNDDVECVLDHVIQREVQLATKEGRQPDLMSKFVRDELFGYLVAGHETSATTLAWGLKYMVSTPTAQTKLREHLHACFGDAKKERRLPNVKEITKSKIPYLDATLEEIYRLAGTSAAVLRKTTTDVIVLGCVIPKGTDVFMSTLGPDFVSPALHVDEHTRSETSQQAKDKHGSWETTTISDFEPERWLKKSGGAVEFNPQAGPSLLFGGGMRGCFGRRLAELQIKIMLTLIIWTFDLEALPEQLSGFVAEDGITHSPRQCYLRLKKRTELS